MGDVLIHEESIRPLFSGLKTAFDEWLLSAKSGIRSTTVQHKSENLSIRES